MVPWDKYAEFVRNARWSESVGQTNTIGWNNYWRGEFEMLFTDEFMEIFHSDRSREYFVRHYFSGSFDDEMEFLKAELIGQWSDADLVISSALMLKVKLPRKLSASEIRAIRGLRKSIAEHKKRLMEYIKDPFAKDNKGFLKNVPKDRQRKIIESRIRELKEQIETFQKDIKAIQDGSKTVLPKTSN